LSEAGYLLDTNVISETRRKRADANVVAFLASIAGQRTFVSVLTIGELRKGAVLRRRLDRYGGDSLDLWIDGVEARFLERVLPLDLRTARLWGELSAARPRPIIDTLIAATAIVRDLTLVTRNTRDVADTGVAIVDPWKYLS
jgi:predicted nucleic acid-binding protein